MYQACVCVWMCLGGKCLPWTFMSVWGSVDGKMDGRHSKQNSNQPKLFHNLFFINPLSSYIFIFRKNYQYNAIEIRSILVIQFGVCSMIRFDLKFLHRFFWSHRTRKKTVVNDNHATKCKKKEKKREKLKFNKSWSRDDQMRSAA